MSRRVSIVLVSLAWVLAACAGSSGPSGPELSASAGYRASGEAITVVEFSQEGAEIHYNAPHDAFGLAVAEEIAGALRKRGHRADAVPAGAVPENPVIVSGRIVLIDAGSRVARWLAGSGKAKFGVEGSLQRADGAKLASFANERWSGFGFLGGNPVSLVQKCLRAVGDDIAKMIDTGQYRGVGADREH